MGPCCQNANNSDQTRGLQNQEIRILNNQRYVDKKREVKTNHEENEEHLPTTVPYQSVEEPEQVDDFEPPQEEKSIHDIFDSKPVLLENDIEKYNNNFDTWK